MTLPTDITLPLEDTLILSENKRDLLTYIRKLIYVIGTQIQSTNQAVNGTSLFFTDTSNPPYLFILGSSTPGTATYTNTILWTRRINGVNFVNFDITWSGHTGTGNLLIQAPFTAQNSQELPYSGTIEADNMTFSSGYTYLTANISPNTNTIGVFQNGSGKALIALPISSSGHLRGSIIYAGNQFN